ncbi:thiolase family protein, partial [Mycobacterium tuberculosis]|nr:thiolase family protein [Mycobacterium tuberculosis]
MTSPENARNARDPVYLLGYGSATTHEYLTDRMNMRRCRFDSLGAFPNLTTTATAEAARQAYA